MTEAYASMAAPLSFVLATRLAGAVPAGAAHVIAGLAGRAHYHLAASRRRAYLSNVSQAIDFNGYHRPWSAFQRHALNVIELLGVVSEPSRAMGRVRVAGGEHIDRALANRRGMILTTLHVGNWELAGLRLAYDGYPLTTVAGEQLRAGWSDALKRFKDRCGIRIVSPSDSTRALHRDLSANRVLVLHLDGDIYTGGEEAVLLGRKVLIPRGPASLSRVMQAPIAFAFARRAGDGYHEVVIETPMEPPASRSDEHEMTLKLARRMENCILAAPGEWCIFRKL